MSVEDYFHIVVEWLLTLEKTVRGLACNVFDFHDWRGEWCDDGKGNSGGYYKCCRRGKIYNDEQ